MGVPLRPLAIAGARSSYREVAPPAALTGVLACGWHGRTGWARPLRVLPDGCADLVWDGDALTVVDTVGAPLRLWFPAAASRVGVRLRCGAAAAVLGTSMPELPAVTRLSDLWGADARRAEEVLATTADPDAQRGILETLVARRSATPDRRVLAAVHALGVTARTSEVAGGSANARCGGTSSTRSAPGRSSCTASGGSSGSCAGSNPWPPGGRRWPGSPPNSGTPTSALGRECRQPSGSPPRRSCGWPKSSRRRPRPPRHDRPHVPQS